MSCFYSFCFGRTITSHSKFPKQVPALCVSPICLIQAATTAAGIGCLYCSVHPDASKMTLWQGQIEPASHATKPVFCRRCAKYWLEFAWGIEQVLLLRKNSKHSKTLQFYQVLSVFNSQMSECSSNSTSPRTVTLELLLFIYLFFVCFFCFRGR